MGAGLVWRRCNCVYLETPLCMGLCDHSCWPLGKCVRHPSLGIDFLVEFWGMVRPCRRRHQNWRPSVWMQRLLEYSYSMMYADTCWYARLQPTAAFFQLPNLWKKSKMQFKALDLAIHRDFIWSSFIEIKLNFQNWKLKGCPYIVSDSRFSWCVSR